MLKPVWTGTKFVMKPVVEWTTETALPACAQAGGYVAAKSADLAVRGLKATPGLAWAGTKLAARGTARTAKIAGQVAAAPVVLPAKAALWTAKTAAGAVVGTLTAPLRAGGGTPDAPSPDQAKVATDEVQRAAAEARSEEDAVVRGMPEAQLVRKVCRAMTTGARPEQVRALTGALQPHTLAWLRTLKQEEVCRVVVTDIRHLARHLAGDVSASGLPTFGESKARETAKAQEAREERVIAESPFAAKLAAKRDARRGNCPGAEHFEARDARHPLAG